MAGGYRLEPSTVDMALNNASRSANNNDVNTPAVSKCELSVVWTRTALGSIAPTMNGHGTLRALREAAHPLSYDARS